MALIVGNLLTDPEAQSFISVDDADAYLAPEQNETWDLATVATREAALTRASRWLVATYRFHPLDDTGLVQIGHVVTRLAAETLDRALFTGTETGKAVQSMSAGSVSVTYATAKRADAAGIAWPWLNPMLAGLIMSGSTSFVRRA